MSQPEQTVRPVAVVPAAPADRDRAARVLAAAFATDAHTVGLLPHRDTDAQLFAMFSASVTERLRTGGQVWLARDPADGRVLGVAMWEAPGEKGSMPARLRSVVAALRVHRGRICDAMGTNRLADRHRPRVPHWYLAVIGTDPAARGRGAASALIRHRLGAADARGHGTYLESSTPDNVPIYQRYGFSEIATVPARGTTPLIGMWRPPAAPPGG